MKKTLKILIPLALAAALGCLGMCAVPTLATCESSMLIKIPAGATYDIVADSLAKYEGTEYADAVLKVMRMMKPDLAKRHGAYRIDKGTAAYETARRLCRGAQTPITLTINGFRDINSLTERVSAKFDFDADSLRLALDPAVLHSYGLTQQQALALFINDSYEFYWNASPDKVVEKIGEHYNNVWNEERTAKAADLGLTPAEVMTICSIVDEETNMADEKGKVARVYMNRLKKGMKLQADPTVRFALNDFSIRRIKGEHLQADSPYNTYRHAGLPPGPIRTTGVATIDSLLQSAPSDHIYMCAKEDFSGYHNFASSYEEHMRNARAYQQALDARNIK